MRLLEYRNWEPVGSIRWFLGTVGIHPRSSSLRGRIRIIASRLNVLNRNRTAPISVHNYCLQTPGQHYFLGETLSENTRETQLCMTAYGRGVSVGDRILITQQGHSQQYTVAVIDYYGDAPDLWMALLIKLNRK